MKLANKAAFITGGPSGIGLEAALRSLAEGSRVLVADIGFGESESHALFVATEEQFGGPNIMYNNADILGSNDLIYGCKEDGCDRVLNIGAVYDLRNHRADSSIKEAR